MPIEVPPASGSVLPLDQAKQHLNISGSTSDAELQATIDAAEARLSQEVGALRPADRTDRVLRSGDGTFLLLPTAPASNLTAVVSADEAATALDLSMLVLDGNAGTISYADGWSVFRSPAYMATYSAGWADVPADLLYAIRELVRHLWQTQRGMPLLSDGPVDMPPAGFALPNRVLEMIAPHRQSVVG